MLGQQLIEIKTGFFGARRVAIGAVFRDRLPSWLNFMTRCYFLMFLRERPASRQDCDTN
jgi:hypothetical protein